MSEKLRVTNIVRWSIIGLFVAGLATVPIWGSQYVAALGVTFLIYIALSQMWNLLAGYSGLMSLGQQSFIGLGGYTLAALSLHHDVPLWAGAFMGGTVSLLFALVISVPLFRTRGVYFAVGTWIVAEALGICFSNWSYVRYGMGLFVQPAYKVPLYQIYYAALLVGLGSVILVYTILRSKLGLGLMAMRDDEEAAQNAGVEAFRCKLYCFLVAAFVTGLAAGVLYVQQIFIQPYKAFSIDWTVRLLFIVIIGGIGTIEGPIIGALILVILQQVFSEWLNVGMLLLGGVCIAVMLVAPRGIAGLIHERLGFELVSLRRE